MENRIKSFQSLAEVFARHGFSLYLVGGTVRDYLLGYALEDMDAVSDATPTQIMSFLR